MTTADPIAAAGLHAVVAHARMVPSAARDAFAFAAIATGDDAGSIVLRTCHRVEVYRVASADEDEPSVVSAAPPGALHLRGADAARHLMRVAAGLDSVVVGEDQILHQLRESIADRRVLDPVLGRAFQLALHVGRETRSWREGPPRSLADVALDVIAAEVASIERPAVLVVGAGRMARLAAHAAARRGARVLVANRSRDRAEALAAEVRGDAAAFGEAADLPQVDAIIVALSGRWPLGSIARGALLTATSPVVDLSSPPALDDTTRAALGSRYTSVDDLASGMADVPATRLRGRIEAAVERAVDELERWTLARATVPAIEAIANRAEARRSEEIERLFRRADLSDGERELVDQMTRRLIAGLLHDPIATLRDDQTGDLERAARALFAL